MWASSLAPLALDLVEQGNVFIKVDKAHEGDELVHDRLFKVYLDAERSLHQICIEDLLLLCGELVVIGHLNRERILVSIVIQVDEAIV